jgi:uncharacterized glyoxalase superfamily protein PhnB
VSRLDAGEGRIGHAELRIGGGTVFLADEFPDFENIASQSATSSRAQENQSATERTSRSGEHSDAV